MRHLLPTTTPPKQTTNPPLPPPQTTPPRPLPTSTRPTHPSSLQLRYRTRVNLAARAMPVSYTCSSPPSV
ncbi:hypothetical protein EMCG_07093 [[Emmonsia] crescens]|uniref:Uncharacterized protein n=1 Tax=[Emmonsia] crescens TaxID=73230 RepID=A0A0G2IA98_9EURO|nr:hypothetical protein EMCG_07093 [Emmonsia crescens UAMH 3008]